MARKIVQLWKDGLWDKDFLIVSEVLEAETATIIVSSEADSKIELKASGDIGTKVMDIADASLDLGMTRHKNIGVKIIAESNITPLYQVVGLKRKLFGGPDLVIKSLDEGEDPFESYLYNPDED